MRPPILLTRPKPIPVIYPTNTTSTYVPLQRQPLSADPVIMSSSVRANSASPSCSSSRKAVKASATASAPSSRPPTRSSSDPYYGHEETAVLCARFITSLFQCPNIPTATAPGAPTPTLAHFVAYALHRTRLPSIVTFAALLLLQRLKAKFPAARGSSGHRLFVSAFMISSKVICDDTYSNQSWGIVAQKMFALKEINQMEREMCGYLEWNLNVGGEEVVSFESNVRAEFGPRAVANSSRSDESSASSSAAAAYHMPKPVHHVYPTPETTPDVSRPIRPVPSPYKHKSFTQQASVTSAANLPSPLASPQYEPPHFSSSTSSSLQSSPASDDCKTPSPVAVAPSAHHARVSSKGGYESVGIRRQHNSHMNLSSYPVNVGGW